MSSLAIVLIIILLCGGISVAPLWPHAQQFGYAPSGLLGIVLIVVLILAIMGRL